MSRGLRVLLTPHDIAGQMGILSRGFRQAGYDATSVHFGDRRTYLKFELDHVVRMPRSRLGRGLKSVARSLPLLARHDVIHYFFGRSIVPGLLDARLARALGKVVVVHFRGSDVTEISRKIAATSPDQRSTRVHRGNLSQQQLVERWRKIAHELLISTPDLWREVPDAELVPQAIDLTKWPFVPRKFRPADRLIIGHAPTNRAVKGTEHVLGAIDQLRARGFDVELELIAGVPPTEVRRRMEKCHLAIDQIAQGAYGNVSLQFMALGVPTINYLDPIYAARGIDVPTIRTTPESLADDIEAAVLTPEALEPLAHEARAYVERAHSVPVIVDRLIEIYARHSRPA